jgi:hypothetical protein
MTRQIYYAIITIPLELIQTAIQQAPKTDLQQKGLVLSTDHTNPPDKAITIEDSYIKKYAKQGQDARTILLPIEETNRWTKLPKKYIIRIDLYFS